MRTVIIKFVSQTDHKPARWSVTSPNGTRRYISTHAPEFDPCATDYGTVTAAARLAGYEPVGGDCVGWHDSVGWIVAVK